MRKRQWLHTGRRLICEDKSRLSIGGLDICPVGKAAEGDASFAAQFQCIGGSDECVAVTVARACCTETWHIRQILNTEWIDARCLHACSLTDVQESKIEPRVEERYFQLPGQDWLGVIKQYWAEARCPVFILDVVGTRHHVELALVRDCCACAVDPFLAPRTLLGHGAEPVQSHLCEQL